MNLPRRKKVRGKGPQERNPSHLRWIRGFECLVCHKTGQKSIAGIEAAHVRMGTDGGMGLKPSDRWVVPLCGTYHAEQHRIGEAAFEARYDDRSYAVGDVLVLKEWNPAAYPHTKSGDFTGQR